jgi:hypothetical protein
MRLNTVFKVLGLSAALAMPLALVGCDDDETTTTTDAAPTDGAVIPSGDGGGSTDVAPKLDVAPATDSGVDVAKPAVDSGVDAAGDAASVG